MVLVAINASAKSCEHEIHSKSKAYITKLTFGKNVVDYYNIRSLFEHLESQSFNSDEALERLTKYIIGMEDRAKSVGIDVGVHIECIGDYTRAILKSNIENSYIAITFTNGLITNISFVNEYDSFDDSKSSVGELSFKPL